MIYGTFVEAFGEFARQLAFLSRAIGREHSRPMFLNIKIEPSEGSEGKFRALASDGRRLHIVDPLSCLDNIGVEPGAWRFLRSTPKTAWMAKVNDKDVADFPDYKRVIPEGEPVFETSYYSGCMEREPWGSILAEAVRFINKFPHHTVINPAYLMDLGREEWRVYETQASKSIVFESGNLKAVIMPI
jgi:hypothetical protein